MATIKLEIRPMPVQRHVRVKVAGRANDICVPLGELDRSDLDTIATAWKGELIAEWERQRGDSDADAV